MFNLIMGGTPEYFEHWPMYRETNGRADFPINRMFEGTSDFIRAKLTPLNSKALSFIEKLTTVFISEVYQDTHGQDKITLRIGKINDLKLKGKNVYFSFYISQQYPEIHVTDKELYKHVLELGSYGLSRTHWGVKESNLNSILQQLSIEHENINLEDLEQLPEKFDNLHSIKTVQDFMAAVLKHSHQDGEEIFYRGHSDVSYDLAPSVFRKNKKSNYIYLHDESSLVREALTARPNEFTSDKTMLDKLVRMQHYGLPTRLLDITSNPLIALYFACSQIRKDDNGSEIDGHVIIFKVDRSKIKFFDSDTVSCISNLSMLNQSQKDELISKIPKDKFNSENSACLKLLHHIKDEKPYFKDVIEPTDLERILFVKGRVSNERMSSQSGAFLLFGNNAVYPDLISNTDAAIGQEFKIEKLVIKNKEKIIKELAMLNITDATVYQGMETTMKLIAGKFATQE